MKKLFFIVLIIMLALSGCSIDEDDISVRCSECGKEFYVKDVDDLGEDGCIIHLEIHDMHDISEYEDSLSWSNGYGVLDPDVVEEVLYGKFDIETADALISEMFSKGYTDLSKE